MHTHQSGVERSPVVPLVCPRPRHYLNLQVPCRGPGVDQDPPYECPLDHFVDVAFWTADAATMVYRPSNFLTLPQVPEELKNSRQARSSLLHPSRLEGGSEAGALPDPCLRLPPVSAAKASRWFPHCRAQQAHGGLWNGPPWLLSAQGKRR